MPVDADVRLLAERGRERGERALQPEILERLGPQPARDPAYVLGAVRGRSRAARRAARAAPRGSRAASPSTCSITPVSVWPTSSCSSRAIRRRSPSWTSSACRALSRRSDSSRSSISLNVCASATTSGPPSTCARCAGRQRIVPAHRLGELVERAERAAQQHQIESPAGTRSPTTSTSSSVAADRHRDRHRRKDQRRGTPAPAPARSCRTPARTTAASSHARTWHEGSHRRFDPAAPQLRGSQSRPR